jgi:hypothetical protein
MLYVGYLPGNEREVFTSKDTPTEETHSLYLSVVGPFKTRRAIEILFTNPNVQTVAEAERLARQ